MASNSCGVTAVNNQHGIQAKERERERERDRERERERETEKEREREIEIERDTPSIFAQLSPTSGVGSQLEGDGTSFSLLFSFFGGTLSL